MAHLIPVISLLLALPAFSLSAETILDTNFANAEVKSYANNEIIGTGDNSANRLTARVDAANAQVNIVEADGARVLELVNTDAAQSQTGISKAIPAGIASHPGLQIKGSVTFTPLSGTNARGVFLIAVNSGDWITTSATVTAIHLSLESNLGLKYGTTDGVKPALKLIADTRYRIDFSADFSNPEQNTWEFSVFESDMTDPVFTSGPLKTRAPHIIPGVLALSGGFAKGSTSEPFIRIHQASLTATTP